MSKIRYKDEETLAESGYSKEASEFIYEYIASINSMKASRVPITICLYRVKRQWVEGSYKELEDLIVKENIKNYKIHAVKNGRYLIQKSEGYRIFQKHELFNTMGWLFKDIELETLTDIQMLGMLNHEYNFNYFYSGTSEYHLSLIHI